MRRTMGKVLVSLSVALYLTAGLGCQDVKQMTGVGVIQPEKKMMLFNGKDFSGLERFLPDVSVNVDDVWQVKDGVIHCTGKPNGFIRTKSDFANYHLHVEWRWVDEPTNSGVLLHATGPDKVWPKCIEAQLKVGRAGDFVLIGGPGIAKYGQMIQDTSKQFVSIKKRRPSTEQPPGLWTVYDIYCKEDKIVLYVNGMLQNEGAQATETSGKICLQSEGSPIEFRNIYVAPAY